MNLRRENCVRLLACILTLLGLFCSQIHAEIIDFETLPEGDPNDRMEISDQFKASYGVTFRMSDGSFPLLAKIGEPRTAFAGYPNDGGPDMPAPEQGVGQYFLTDDGSVGTSGAMLIVDYVTPVKAASGVILDIDGRSTGQFTWGGGDEQWTIQARDVHGTVVAQEVLTAGALKTGDGMATPWIIKVDSEIISSISFQYTGTKFMMDVGLAFDNFSPSSVGICPYVLLGDLNRDCTVDFLDFALMAQNWLVDCYRDKIILFSENFDKLSLGSNMDEVLAGDEVWTKSPPANWIIDDSGIPGAGDPARDGVTEWAGWSFADKAWWTEIAADQNRAKYLVGNGTIAVADLGEWDDMDHDPGPYSSSIRMPAIDISGIAADTLQISFDSSWSANYIYAQTATITVEYDGAAPVEVLHWQAQGDQYKLTLPNERVLIDLGNPPGAQKVVITFALTAETVQYWTFYGQWWAIDNIIVTGFLTSACVPE